MKVSIRLQNHGCANHPYWWIVVAPNRKNIKGRFLEHVGYWSPRQGVFMQRQVILNMPRIKHWISCGAVPTFKVQKFLSLWGVLPKPWHYARTPEQQQALKKPESEWTDKDRIKEERKRKRRERVKLSPLNYHAPQAKFKALQFFQYIKYRLKLREKINAAERENQILRELLLHNEFYKVNRINELSGNVVYDDTQQLQGLEAQLAKAKAELALVEKTHRNSSPVQKIRAMQHINELVDKIRAVEAERQPFRTRNNPIAHEGENITQFQLDKKLEYELVVKKLENMSKEFEHLDKLMETVTLEEYANYLVQQDPELPADLALDTAREYFQQRGEAGSPPLTKFDLYYEEELDEDADFIIDDEVPDVKSPRKKYVSKRKAEENEEDERLEKAEDEAMTEQERAEKLEAQQAERLEEQNEDDQQRHNDPSIANIPEASLIKFLMARPDVLVPTNRPVHPFPDLNTYVPEEYYEPIRNMDLQMVPVGSLEPNDELVKYHKKREYAAKVKVEPKKKQPKQKAAKQGEGKQVEGKKQGKGKEWKGEKIIDGKSKRADAVV